MNKLSQEIRDIPIQDAPYIEEDSYISGFSAGLEAAARLVESKSYRIEALEKAAREWEDSLYRAGTLRLPARRPSRHPQ